MNFEKGITGLCGPQGIGKTTLCKTVDGITCSLDDFYKPHSELKSLGFEFRGFPGTHDLALLKQCLLDHKQGKSLKIPIYDKSCHGGKGDRIGFRHCEFHEVFVVEGWMMGYLPNDGPVADELRAFNEALKEYGDVWKLFDHWIFLEIADLNWIYQWRYEQEQDLIEQGKNGMDRKTLKRFVDSFIPVYKNFNHIKLNSKTIKVNKERKFEF